MNQRRYMTVDESMSSRGIAERLVALSSRGMFSKAYDSEKKHIDRWNQLVTGRQVVRGTTRQGEINHQRSYTVKGKLLNDYVIDVTQ
jgi:hypothetical protein